jgi:hypothetical protein
LRTDNQSHPQETLHISWNQMVKFLCSQDTNTGRHLEWVTWGTTQFSNSAVTYTDRGLTPSPDCTKAKGGRGQQASRGHHYMMAKSIKRIMLSAGQLRTIWMPWLRFFCDIPPL